MKDGLSTLDPGPLSPEPWLRPPEPQPESEPRSISARGVVVGAAIGLASGLLLDYLALFTLRFLSLPWPGPSLAEVSVSDWFNPVLIACTVLGVLYYGRDG